MKKSEIFRQILIVILIPVYFLVGIVVSESISYLTGIWVYYIYAISMPLIGLGVTWLVAPFFKVYNIIIVYIIGAFLAFAMSYPSFYPEGHILAYTKTYKPFIITILWGAFISCGLIAYEIRNSKP